jgi:hypothetical protein
MITKSKKYKDKFFSLNPTLLDEGTNVIGQKWYAYEHPLYGDEVFVYVLIDDVLANSEFFDTDDFFEGSEYEPVLVDGEIVCKFETDN